MNRQRQKHIYCAFVSEPVNEIHGLKCVCPGTCEVVCGRREGELIKPMITLMRSQGVKPEKAFHFLSHSIPLSPASIHPSLLCPYAYTFLLFFTSDAKLSHPAAIWSFSVCVTQR